MEKNRLYTFLGIACVMGYSWLFFSVYQKAHGGNFSLCLFKNVTGIPCPSCGATRALILFGQGEILESLLLNPIGMLLAVIMIILPLWLAYDLAAKKQTLFGTYKKMEETFRIKWISVIFILLLMANWTWNIYKHL
jgi:hypothetical protein